MRNICKIIVLLVFSILSNIVTAQNSWLWAESIDRSNTWNAPFYKTYNTADKLLSYRADSANYCTDCSLSNLLWKGIEANKIIIYQLDKKAKLSVQKTSAVKTKLFSKITQTSPVESIRDALAISEIVIYRRPDTTNTKTLSAFPIEWIAINIPFETDTVSLYLKSKECFAYLKFNDCKWVHPLNHQVRLTITDALIQRNYIIRDFILVSASNLKVLVNYKTSLPLLAQTLAQNDIHTSTGKLEVNTDTLLIRLQAICTADITSDYNRGFNKAHIVEYLLKLHAENKIKGYTYHEAGYFTPMQAKDLSNHLLVESMQEEDITYRRLPSTSLTQLHTLKTYTKISATDRITNDWLIFGLKETPSTFNNRFAIAFKYEDVLTALATTNRMWYNGINQNDSIPLTDALRKQYIDYNEITICSVYGDTISWFVNIHYDTELSSPNPVLKLLNEYTTPLVSDISESHIKVLRKENANSTTTLKLNYHFTPAEPALLVDALLNAVQTNKISVYRDKKLSDKTTSSSVLDKLDKTRFYKTGNAKKDSIYISKIPIEERFIQSWQLSEFTISSNYSTTKKKSTNEGFSFGIFIPATLNPQYETDTLCYVSFNEFASFLKKNKTYKKLYPQFVSLLNERAIVSVEDFYDLLLYDVTDENAAVPSELPAFVRERIMGTE